MANLDQEICTNAFIAYCYQEGNYNPQDLLQPFVLKSISTLSRTFFSLSELASEIEKDCGKEFPKILIEKELLKLVYEGKIDYDKKQEIYSVKIDLSDVKEKYRKSQDETTYFLKSLKDFITEKNSVYAKIITAENVMQYFEEYCMDNLREIVKFLGGMYSKKVLKNTSSEIENLIEAFFEIKVKSDEKLRNEFENIFNGLHLRKIVEICSEKLQEEAYSLKEKIIYLDTNIIIRILGYQSDELNLLGTELLSLLHEYNFEIRVFPETIEELNYLLRGYSYCYKKLIPEKKISHIYQTLRNKKIQPYEIPNIIADIPTKLKEKKITIDADVDFFPRNPDFFNDGVKNLSELKYKKKADSEIVENSIKDTEYNYDVQIRKYEKIAKHDLCCIEKIQKLRNGAILSRFEDTPYYFVTADLSLINFNNKSYTTSHIAETISDYSISFLLYFYKPNFLKDISLHSFIAANYSKSELSITSWLNYVRIISEKYEKDEINKQQFGYLLTAKILEEEKFSDATIDDIVSEALIEYDKFVNEKECLTTENANMVDELIKSEEKLNSAEVIIKNLKDTNSENSDCIENLSQSKASLENTVKGLENRLNNQDKKLLTQDIKIIEQNRKISKQEKSFRLFRHITFTVFFLFGIILLFLLNKVFGSIVSSISFALEILNIIDSSTRFKIFNTEK